MDGITTATFTPDTSLSHQFILTTDNADADDMETTLIVAGQGWPS